MTTVALAWMLIGLGIGALSRAVRPGGDPGGAVVAILVGIAGALLAGFLIEAAGATVAGSVAGYLAAALGAILSITVYRVILARRL